MWGVTSMLDIMKSHDQSCGFTDVARLPFLWLNNIISLSPGVRGVSNSPVHSWTLCGPVSARSILGSTPSSTCPARRVSDWPEPPSAGAARGSPPAARPTWAARQLWRRTGRSAPLQGCSACSPGRPGSRGHCSFPETVPPTAEEERTKRNEIAWECPRKNNSITDTFHYSLLWFLPAFPPSNLQLRLISSLSCPLPAYLRGIRRLMQSASVRDLQGRQQEESGTEQHGTQHGSRGRQENTGTGDATAADRRWINNKDLKGFVGVNCWF